MSLFPSAIDLLSLALNATVAELVTYTTATTGGASVSIKAVRGRQNVDVQETEGAILQTITQDWLVAAADLAGLSGGATGYTPVKGDRITTQANSGSASIPQPGAPALAAQTYELITPPFTPSDHGGRRLRLHTVRIL